MQSYSSLPRRDPIREAVSRSPLETDMDEALSDDDIARAARAKKGSPFLSTEQAAFYLGLSPRKLQSMRGEGTGPRFRRHARYVRYHIADLDSWSKDSAAKDSK
jgi:hypothetical protein